MLLTAHADLWRELSHLTLLLQLGGASVFGLLRSLLLLEDGLGDLDGLLGRDGAAGAE